MATIRDLVTTIRQREGVLAAVILGPDGLLIDGQTSAELDAEDLAAFVPALVGAADGLGRALSEGTPRSLVTEFGGVLAIVVPLTPDAILLVVTRAHETAGLLLLELRRNITAMAELV